MMAPRPGSCQTSRTSVEGGVIFVHQPALAKPIDGSPNNWHPPLGGDATGVFGAAVIDFSKFAGFAGEVSLPLSRIEAQQFFSYDGVAKSDVRHRDIAFSALGRAGKLWGRVGIDGVAGIAIVWADTLASTVEGRFGTRFEDLGPYGPFEQIGRLTTAAVFGGNALISTSGRLKVVAGGRVFRVRRDYSELYRGFGQNSLRLNLGIRVTL